MNEPVFTHDVFLSHSAKDKTVVRPLAERLRQDGLKVWFDEWVLPVAASRQSAAFSTEGLAREEEADGGALPRRRYADKIEEGLEPSRLTFQPSAFILQPFPDAPIQGSLAQFLYINWRPVDCKQEPSDAGAATHTNRRRLRQQMLWFDSPHLTTDGFLASLLARVSVFA